MKVTTDHNLVKNFPTIARQWNYEKNGNLSPLTIAPKSQEKVWWKCDFNPNHEWREIISNRTVKYAGCKICAREFKFSFPARVILYYLRKVYPDCVCEKQIGKYFIDIYIPTYNIAIEHDGSYHHNFEGSKIRENKKDKFLDEMEIFVIRLKQRKQDENIIIKENIIYYKSTYQYKEILNILIESLFDYLFLKTGKKLTEKIDFELNLIYIEQLFFHEKKIRTIAFKNSEIVLEWSSNNPFGADMISSRSSYKALWICPDCHFEYSATINNRIRLKSSCPYCSNMKVNINNCLATNFPELAKEWDYDKNNELTPYDVVPGAEKKVWWLCNKCKNSWSTFVYQRVGKSASGCPYCSHNKVYHEISLGYVFPNLIEWWNYEKNDKETPFDITAHSNKRVYWKCPKCNDEFLRAVNGFWKIKDENKCKKCLNYNKKLKKKEKIKKYWSYKNDVELTTDLINSKKEYIWNCDKNHEWKESIHGLINSNKKCPYCKIANKRLSLSKYKKLIKEWDYDKNKISPELFTAGSGVTVYWKCDKNHSWTEKIMKRALRNYGCPYCSGRRASLEYSFATLHKELLVEWDYDKNGDLNPSDITPGSGKLVSWICKVCGNKWKNTIVNRAKGQGCNKCRKKNQYGNLEETYPELIKEWNYKKNIKNPSEYSAHSNYKAHWLCNQCQHEWEANIYSRSAKKSGCPKCYKLKKKTIIS